jgi:PAS domain S-box-containing protein
MATRQTDTAGSPKMPATESELTYRIRVESVRDYAICMLNPEGIISTWNTGAQRIKGYKPEEIIGRHFSGFYPETAAQSGYPEFELSEAIKEGRFEDEGWRIRKDDSRFWANVVITPIWGPNREQADEPEGQNP